MSNLYGGAFHTTVWNTFVFYQVNLTILVKRLTRKVYKKLAGVYLMYCFMDGLAISLLVCFLALFRKIELIKEEKSLMDISMVNSII